MRRTSNPPAPGAAGFAPARCVVGAVLAADVLRRMGSRSISLFAIAGVVGVSAASVAAAAPGSRAGRRDE
jgi:hypothetical protein